MKWEGGVEDVSHDFNLISVSTLSSLISNYLEDVLSFMHKWTCLKWKYTVAPINSSLDAINRVGLESEHIMLEWIWGLYIILVSCKL